MIKKTVSVFVCLVLVFSFSACGGEKNETNESKSIVTVSESTTTAVSTTESTETVSTTDTTTSQTTSETVTTTGVTPQTTNLPASSAPETTSLPSPSTGAYTVTESTTTTKGETVSFTIECKSINNNLGKLDSEKKDFVPKDGIIFSGDVPVNNNETVFDVLKRVCAENHCKADCKYCKNGIQIEYTFTPAFNTYYVEGIHQLYEFDCGASSGWVYSVNGVYPEVGCSSYDAKSGDVIVFSYTCERGDSF